LLGRRTRAEWAAPLLAAGVPAGPVQTIDGAFSLAAELGLDVVDETDGVRTVRFPARLSATPATVRRRPPDLDEHGSEIRDEEVSGAQGV
jgi:crotonobetainyl-CoA:carnitine CoA-transferase CaiB-like acyl-CoA transferase